MSIDVRLFKAGRPPSSHHQCPPESGQGEMAFWYFQNAAREGRLLYSFRKVRGINVLMILLGMPDIEMPNGVGRGYLRVGPITSTVAASAIALLFSAVLA